MSHNVEYRTYKSDVSKKKVEKTINQYVAQADWQEGCSGLFYPIRWIDKKFNSCDEAGEYIDSIDRHDYDNIAVKFKDGRKVFWLVKFEYHT